MAPDDFFNRLLGMSDRGTEGVGFRTSLLDPKPLATGLGRRENVNTTWYQDESRSFPPDCELIALPSAGSMPTAFFRADHSWSIELNPANHAPIAFEPLAADCSAGVRDEVRVQDIRHDKVGSSLTYFVEFVEPVDAEPAGPGKLTAPLAY